MKRARVSLQARALGWLAQREHSRIELRRKLLRAARSEIQPDTDASSDAHAEADGAALVANVECILDALEAANYLSEDRFVESRVRVRASRQGARRIQHELGQHGLRLDAAQLAGLQASEWQRASEVWRRRFAVITTDPHERARQVRFLASRGFSGDVIWRIVAGEPAPVSESAG